MAALRYAGICRLKLGNEISDQIRSLEENFSWRESHGNLKLVGEQGQIQQKLFSSL